MNTKSRVWGHVSRYHTQRLLTSIIRISITTMRIQAMLLVYLFSNTLRYNKTSFTNSLLRREMFVTAFSWPLTMKWDILRN
jgi:hypothetical protein